MHPVRVPGCVQGRGVAEDQRERAGQLWQHGHGRVLQRRARMGGQHGRDQIGVGGRPDPVLAGVDKIGGELDGVGQVTVVTERDSVSTLR